MSSRKSLTRRLRLKGKVADLCGFDVPDLRAAKKTGGTTFQAGGTTSRHTPSTSQNTEGPPAEGDIEEYESDNDGVLIDTLAEASEVMISVKFTQSHLTLRCQPRHPSDILNEYLLRKVRYDHSFVFSCSSILTSAMKPAWL